MTFFEPNHTIFANEEVLRPNTYIPDYFPARQQELLEFRKVLQPVINDAPPKHVFVNGPPGSGKTAMTRFVLDKLEFACEEHGVDFSSVYIDCESGANGISSYELAIEIINKLRQHPDGPTREQMSSTGHPYTRVKNTLFEDLNDIGGTVLIVLDELHTLSDEKLLKQIPRAPHTHLNNDTHVGLIGISNDPTVLDDLDTDVKDTLTAANIELSPYNANQLQLILQKRAEDAFQKDVVEDSLVQLCAALAVRHDGSARRAINILREAGEIARDNKESRVIGDHVRTADGIIDRNSEKFALQTLTRDQSYALFAVLIESIGSDKEIPTIELFQTYEQVCKVTVYDANTMNPFSSRLKELNEKKLVHLTRTFNGGRQNKYKPTCTLSLVIEVFDSDTTYDDLLEYVVKEALDHDEVTADDVMGLNVYNRLDTSD